MSNNFLELLSTNAQIVESSLNQYLTNKNDNGLAKPMAYSLLSGGKRIRPFIVLEAYKLFSGNDDPCAAIPFACALEMIHTYSLIHDDLPCMDNDELRRGKPTNHMVFGEAEALLAGDTLLTYAFEILASNVHVSDKSVRLATIALSKCSGFSGMAGGQMIDINGTKTINSLEELKYMHSLKTGALIRCAVLLGYYAACDTPNEQTVADLEEYATKLGIAFQFRDDILDKISSSELLGKPVGSDDKNEKVTSLSYLSIEEAQQMVNKLTDEAISVIKKYCSDNVSCSLIDLAKYMVGRDK